MGTVLEKQYPPNERCLLGKRADPAQREDKNWQLLAPFYSFNHNTKMSFSNAFWESMRCFTYIRRAVCYFYGLLFWRFSSRPGAGGSNGVRGQHAPTETVIPVDMEREDILNSAHDNGFREKRFGVSAALLQYDFRLNGVCFCLKQKYASLASGVTHAAHQGTTWLWCFLAGSRLHSHTDTFFFFFLSFQILIPKKEPLLRLCH